MPSAKAVRYVLIQKGYVRPNSTKVDQPAAGKVIAVRRQDDRPCTRQVPVVTYKGAFNQ